MIYVKPIKPVQTAGAGRDAIMLEIKAGLIIDTDDLVFSFSRSSGPGGQNVNKVNTRATVFFDVANCRTLSDYQKNRILTRLATRADKKGVLRVVCQKHRTQKANRIQAVQRLAELLRTALEKKPVRKKTTVPFTQKLKRLEQKKRRSALKQQRAEKYLQQD